VTDIKEDAPHFILVMSMEWTDGTLVTLIPMERKERRMVALQREDAYMDPFNSHRGFAKLMWRPLLTAFMKWTD
jgi:hypothetical protein